jgi:hypothetical protein
MYAVDSDLAMIISEGKLLQIHIPITGNDPVKIFINTAIGK